MLAVTAWPDSPLRPPSQSLAAFSWGLLRQPYTRNRDWENCNDPATPFDAGNPPLARRASAVPAPTRPRRRDRFLRVPLFPVDCTLICHTVALGPVRLSARGLFPLMIRAPGCPARRSPRRAGFSLRISSTGRADAISWTTFLHGGG
jgi:hypothetical protein